MARPSKALRKLSAGRSFPFTLPIGKEKDFRGVVDVVHMKAYELGADGQAKEIEIPSEGRDYVDKTRERLVELVAESDDALMEKYLRTGNARRGGHYSKHQQSHRATASSVRCLPSRARRSSACELCSTPSSIMLPIRHTTRLSMACRLTLLLMRKRLRASMTTANRFPLTAFRTVADPFAGRINVMKVISGKLQNDATVLNSSRGSMERLGMLHSIQGKQLDKVPEAHAGDIVACVKLKETQTGDTLCDKQAPIVYDPVVYPEAAIAFAIEPKSRQDEEKISVALHKILEEDPALHFTRDAQTKEFLLSGSGQLHVETVVEKLKKRYGVEVTLHPPKVPYKETITAAR